MKFKDLISSHDDFDSKIWTPIRKVFEYDGAFFHFIKLKKLYFIISKYYNNSIILDQEEIFLEKIQHRLSYILPSLWFHQILLNTISPFDLTDVNNWGSIETVNNKNKTEHNFEKNNDSKNVIGVTNTSDQVTQSWNLIPDLTKNKGDFIIEKNFNLNNLMDKIVEEFNSNREIKISKNNLIENFANNIDKTIVNNHQIIIQSLESLFMRWMSI